MRPRQKFQDCVLIVYRYITGEDEGSAFCRFFPYLNGESGISLDALTACLKQVGYRMTPFNPAEVGDAPAGFLRRFQGEAVMFHASQEKAIAHAVLVRAGVVLDPAPSSPEEGESVEEYFKKVPEGTRIKSLLQVSRMQ